SAPARAKGQEKRSVIYPPCRFGRAPSDYKVEATCGGWGNMPWPGLFTWGRAGSRGLTAQGGYTGGQRPTPPGARRRGADAAGAGGNDRGELPRRDGIRRLPNGKGDMSMRFLMLVRASKHSEAGQLPDAEVVAAVMKYREELREAGVLLDVAALYPTTEGTRI